MTNIGKENEVQKKEKIIQVTARGVASVLKSKLYADANSASCIMTYQPKAPEALAKFKKAPS